MYKLCFNVFSVDFETKTHAGNIMFLIKDIYTAFHILNSLYHKIYVKSVQRQL